MIYGFYKKAPVRSKPYWSYLLETYDPSHPTKNLVMLSERLVNALSQCKGKEWKQHNPKYNKEDKTAFVIDNVVYTYPHATKNAHGEWIEPSEAEIQALRDTFKQAWDTAAKKERYILWLTDEFEPVFVWKLTTNSAKRKYNVLSNK